MLAADFINAGFNLAAGAFVLLNVRRVWRDREARGVSLVAVAFFTAWGAWNVLGVFPMLGAASVVGGMGAFLSNLAYLVSLLVFSRRKLP